MEPGSFIDTQDYENLLHLERMLKLVVFAVLVTAMANAKSWSRQVQRVKDPAHSARHGPGGH